MKISHVRMLANTFDSFDNYDPNTSQAVSIVIGPGSPGAGTTVWQDREFDTKGRAISHTLAIGITTHATY